MHSEATADNPAEDLAENPTVYHSCDRGKNLRKTVFDSDSEFCTAVKKGYDTDALYSKILDDPGTFKAFQIRDGLIWVQNRGGEKVLCIPNAMVGEKSVWGVVLKQAHQTVGHFGVQKTIDYARRWFWWTSMTKDVITFCDTCDNCQRSKAPYNKPYGKLHSLPVPTAPWESIGMDFIGPFPEAKGFNYLWVVICRLTSMVHLIPIRTTTTASELSGIYLHEVVWLHRLPNSIVSDRDSKFTSKWRHELHRILGAKLLMSTAFHPQMDGRTERINRSVRQIFCMAISADQTDWVKKAPMVEFAINSSVSETTGFAPFEINYTRMPSVMPKIQMSGAVHKGICEFVESARQNLNDAYDAILVCQVFQKKQADKHRRPDPQINVGDKVFLAMKDLALPKGRAGKFLPKFIGPYLVPESKLGVSTYQIDLPDELKCKNIHPVFHVSRLRPHHPNDEVKFPGCESVAPYDYGEPDDETGWNPLMGINGEASGFDSM